MSRDLVNSFHAAAAADPVGIYVYMRSLFLLNSRGAATTTVISINLLSLLGD